MLQAKAGKVELTKFQGVLAKIGGYLHLIFSLQATISLNYHRHPIE